MTNSTSKPSSNPKVAVVILNWNGLADTCECLNSLYESNFPNLEIIVVDNGSTDGSQIELAKDNRYTFIETGSNLGYAEGNNVGIRHALSTEADFVLVLNNDTIAAKDMISILVETSFQNPRAILGPLTFYHDQPQRIWWAGTLWLEKAFTFIHRDEGIEACSVAYRDIEPCDYVVGSALFAPAAMFNESGMFDERFFLTYEETDLCYRAKQHNWFCYCSTKAHLWHKVSAAMGGTGSPLQHYFYIRNALLWGERHLPFMVFCGLFLKTAKDVFNPGLTDENNHSIMKRLFWSLSDIWARCTSNNAHPVPRAKFLGFTDYLFRRFGNCPQVVRDLNSIKRSTTPTAPSIN